MKFSVTQLDNGLTVVTDHIPEAHACTLHWNLRAGARQQASDGTAHFFEHLLACGPFAPGGHEVAKYLMKKAHDPSIATGLENITARASIMPRLLNDVISMLGNTVSAGQATPAVFKREQERILSEIGESPGWVNYSISNKSFEQAYAGSTFNNSLLGTATAVAAMTPDDCRSYWEKYFKSNHMALIVSGPVPHDSNMLIAAKAFGNLQPGELPLQNKPVFQAMQSDCLVMDVPMQTIALVWPGLPADDPVINPYIQMLGLLETKLSDIFMEAGAYSTPDVGTAIYSDAGQTNIKYAIKPERALEMTKIVRDIISKPEQWITPEAFADKKDMQDIRRALCTLSTQSRAASIDFKYSVRGQAISYEESDKEIEAVQFQQIVDAHKAIPLNHFNLVGYGPLKTLPKPVDFIEAASGPLKAFEPSAP